MIHTMIIEKYKEMFPFSEEVIDTWFPNGYNSVRVKFKHGVELVFSYQNVNKWRLETRDQFIETMVRGK